MNVLIGCECSGVVRRAFRARGHNAWSCDLKPPEDGDAHHLQGDVRRVLDTRWDLAIFHPDCTYLCNSGVRWLRGRDGKAIDPSRVIALRDAILFFNALAAAPIARKALENPIPHCYARERIGDYTQLIQPWMFGHREMKATCLWLQNLPELVPTNVVGPPPSDPVERRSWAKVHRAAPGPDRAADRARTLPGIAAAMAEQWG